MSNDGLERLLEAEKDAQRTISLWKDRADKAVQDAKEDLRKSNESTLKAFKQRSESELEQTRTLAKLEAEKIKSEGIDRTNSMTKKARSKVPIAVEKAIKVLF